MPIIEHIQKMNDEFVALRRDFHQHPELSHQEKETSAKIAELLTSWGIEVHTGIGGTGVVGVLKCGTGTKRVALRADIDALPILEANQFAHASVNNGVMHACGHDGHITTLLMAARYLAETKNFDGTVYFFFQPAEESGKGAKSMIADGLLEKFPVDYVFGCHNWPETPKMRIGINHDAMMASSNRFKIVVTGKGSHGAMPNLSVDPIFVAAQIYQGLQGIITRNKRPADTAVMSVCHIEAGSTYNVVPGTALMEGTLRTFSSKVTDLVAERMEAIVKNTAAAYGATAELEFNRLLVTTKNNPAAADIVINAAKSIYGEDIIYDQEAVMPSEDFCEYAERVPSAFFFVGAGTTGDHRLEGHGDGPCLLHNSSYDFNDNCLALGASVFAKVVEDYLK